MYPSFFSRMAGKDVLDPVAKAMLKKRDGQGVCESVLQHTRGYRPEWVGLVQNVSRFGSRRAEAND